MNEILVGALELLLRVQRECGKKWDVGQAGGKMIQGVENRSLKGKSWTVGMFRLEKEKTEGKLVTTLKQQRDF